MAKKIEVNQAEYEYLKKHHEESTLSLAALQVERDALKRENEELRTALEKAGHKLDKEKEYEK
jgi:hypothetical protein